MTFAAAHAVSGRGAAAQAAEFVRIKNVNKIYKSRGRALKAIDSVSLDLREGEFVSIVGPSGCGKSTLMMMVAGLVPVSSGEISIKGEMVRKPKPEVTRNFVHATMEGVKYTLAHPEEAVLLKKHQPQLDEKTAVQEIAIIRKLINADNAKGPLGSIDKAKMHATHDLMVKYLGLKDPPPIAETYTNEFLS